MREPGDSIRWSIFCFTAGKDVDVATKEKLSLVHVEDVRVVKEPVVFLPTPLEVGRADFLQLLPSYHLQPLRFILKG